MVEIKKGHLKSIKASPEGMTSNCVEEVDVMSHVFKRLMSADETREVEARGICRSVKRQAKLILIVVLVTLIVCGISTLVMGSVAFIEERQKFNMGLGIPAGGFSVLAAAVSIHTSRGWGTSGASAGAAAAVLWAASGCLLVALIVQCSRTILDPPGFDHGDGPEEESKPSSRDLVVIASVQIAFAIATLLSAVVCARIDYSA